MKNVTKKLLSLGLCAAMVAGMTACGNEGGDAPVGGSGESGSTVESSNAGEQSSDAEQSGSSAGSLYNEGETRTIRVGTWYDHYYDSTHKDIYENPAVSDEEQAQAQFDVVKEIEEKYNVRIEFVNLTWDGIQESINTSILAGTPDCDIYEGDMTFLIPAALNGFVTNLADVLPADNDIFNEQMIFSPTDIGNGDGVYIFKSNSGESQYYNTYPLAFNAQMLEDAGLQNPNELYANGEWTWEKWREYLIALTQDTDGDGVIDVYGFGSRTDFLVQNLLTSNGTYIARNDKENLSSNEVGEVLEFIYNMYNVDRVARPWNADDFNDNQNAYMKGSVACWISAAWISDANKDVELGFDIIWAPWPIGPHGNEETNVLRNGASGNAWMIPTGVKDPELVFTAFQDWQNWYHGDTDWRDGNMTWWEDCAITEENLEVMGYLGSREGIEIYGALGEDLITWSDLLDGVNTPAQFQEIYKQPIQDALDGFFN